MASKAADILYINTPSPLDRRLGGESASQQPPQDREIVSVRSCVRARGVCHVSSGGKSPPSALYLLSLVAGGRIFYPLEIFDL